jgi:enoyl-CoA hydratase/carnithine racemase
MARVRVSTDVRGCRTVLLIAPKAKRFRRPFLTDLLNVAGSAAHDETVRLVLLRSTSAIFCAGADLNEWANVDQKRNACQRWGRAFQALADLQVPSWRPEGAAPVEASN